MAIVILLLSCHFLQHFLCSIQTRYLWSGACSNLSMHASVSNEVVVPELTDDELSALCYAAGYVPFALKKKLKDRSVARQLVVFWF